MPQITNIRGGHATATIDGIPDLVLEGDVIIDNTRAALEPMGNAHAEEPQMIAKRYTPRFSFQLVNPRDKTIFEGERLRNFTMRFDFDNGETFKAAHCYDVTATHKVNATQGTVETMTIVYSPSASSWG
jgi:hypothetical protein